MKNIVTSKQMKSIEKYTIEELGIPSMVLIERASMAAAKIITEKIKPKSVLVFSGNGNNGADGYAVSRMLIEKGIAVYNVFAGNKEKKTQENKVQESILENMGQHVISWSDIKNNSEIELPNGIHIGAGLLLKRKFDLIIDGVLGISINRELQGDVLEVVDYINSQKDNSFVFSLDIPTGLNADSGQVCGQCVNADATITFGQTKAGLLLGKGPDYTGALFYDEAGIIAKKDQEIYAYQTMKDFIEEIFYDRQITGNKGTFGKVLIIGGNAGMAGAGLLSARAAMKVGAGMVKLLSPCKENAEIYLKVCPELMTGFLSEEAYKEELAKEMGWCDTVIIGPGLGISDFSKKIFEEVLNNKDKEMLIDADGLNILADNMDLLNIRKNLGCDTVLTPHPLEFARLFGTDIKERRHQDAEFLKEMADKYNIIIVAKDARSLTANKEMVFVNPYGNSGMAMAGSGDILSGVIGGLIYNIKDVLLAATCGVGIHALAGDYAAKAYSEYTMSANIMLESVSAVIESIKNPE